MVIDDIISLSNNRAEAKNLVLEVIYKTPIPECIIIDGKKIRQIILNYITNAIKYNQVPGEIKVVLKRLDERLYLEVGNRGQDIPELELKRVFEQFYRVEKSRSKDFGGCGLGLTIVKEIVSLHGGEISLRNEPSGWIKVVVQLPVISS